MPLPDNPSGAINVGDLLSAACTVFHACRRRHLSGVVCASADACSTQGRPLKAGWAGRGGNGWITQLKGGKRPGCGEHMSDDPQRSNAVNRQRKVCRDKRQGKSGTKKQSDREPANAKKKRQQSMDEAAHKGKRPGKMAFLWVTALGMKRAMRGGTFQAGVAVARA